MFFAQTFSGVKLREDAVVERIRTTATQAKKTPLRASPRGGYQLASLDEVNAQHVNRKRVCIKTMLEGRGRDTKRLSSTSKITGLPPVTLIVHVNAAGFGNSGAFFCYAKIQNTRSNSD